jgi:hypothetical protein
MTDTDDQGAEMPAPEAMSAPEAPSEHKTPLDALSHEWAAKLEHRERLRAAFHAAQAALAAWDQELLEHAHQVRGLADTILASHPSAPAEPPSVATNFAVPPGNPGGNGLWRRSLSQRPQSPDSPHPGWTEPQGGAPDVTGPVGEDTAPMPQYDGREMPTEPMTRIDPPVRGAHRAGDAEVPRRQVALWVLRTAALITITLLAVLICIVIALPNSILSNAVGHSLVPFGAMTAVLLVPLMVEVRNPLQRWLGAYWRWLRVTTYATWGLVVLKLLMLHAFWPDFVAVWYAGVVATAGFIHNDRVAS